MCCLFFCYLCYAGEFDEIGGPAALYVEDMTSLRKQLSEFFRQKPFSTKFLYFVTRFDFVKPSVNEHSDDDDSGGFDKASEDVDKAVDMEDIISFYVAICGNGSVMVPMSIFPPTEEWHWERKKTIKLRHAYSLHRTRLNDPDEAVQFFAVVCTVLLLTMLVLKVGTLSLAWKANLTGLMCSRCADMAEVLRGGSKVR